MKLLYMVHSNRIFHTSFLYTTIHGHVVVIVFVDVVIIIIRCYDVTTYDFFFLHHSARRTFIRLTFQNTFLFFVLDFPFAICIIKICYVQCVYALYLLCARFHFVLINIANRKVPLYEQKGEKSAPKPKSSSTTTENNNNNKNK